MATSWFLFQDTNNDPYDPQFYSIVGTKPTCLDGSVVCAIFAEVQIIDNVQRPFISDTLQSAIFTALQSGQGSPNVLLKFP